MTEKQHILDRFSDALVAAMIGGADTQDVVRSYEQTHPELSESFKTQERSVELLYGYLREANYPSENEIASAYRLVATGQPERSLVREEGFFARLGSLFAKPSFTYRLAAVAAVFAGALFLWQPWSNGVPNNHGSHPSVSDVPPTGTANSSSSSTEPSSVPPVPSASTSNSGISTAPTASPSNITTNGIDFRGIGGDEDEPEQRSPSTPGNTEDAERLRQLAMSKTELGTVKGISVTTKSKGSISLQWDAVEGALSYVVEIKSANERAFRLVSETAHPNVRLASLAAGDTLSVRITAASGDRKGPVSDAKSIVVP